MDTLFSLSFAKMGKKNIPVCMRVNTTYTHTCANNKYYKCQLWWIFVKVCITYVQQIAAWSKRSVMKRPRHIVKPVFDEGQSCSFRLKYCWKVTSKAAKIKSLTFADLEDTVKKPRVSIIHIQLFFHGKANF